MTEDIWDNWVRNIGEADLIGEEFPEERIQLFHGCGQRCMEKILRDGYFENPENSREVELKVRDEGRNALSSSEAVVSRPEAVKLSDNYLRDVDDSCIWFSRYSGDSETYATRAGGVFKVSLPENSVINDDPYYAVPGRVPLEYAEGLYLREEADDEKIENMVESQGYSFCVENFDQI